MPTNTLGFNLGDGDLEVDPDIITGRGEGETDLFSVEGEDGRTYHGWMAGEYCLPNDGDEQARQDLQHIIHRELLNGALHLAPITSPEYVLDVGTGTGTWAAQFAEENPHCHVVGTDLSLIQPRPSTPNCMFLMENAETDEWKFPYRFDYVHMRNMGPCFKNLGTVLAKAFDSMNAGGWIELSDADWTTYQCLDGSDEGASIESWVRAITKAGLSIGCDFMKCRTYMDEVAAAGFVDIVEKTRPLTGSPWPKEPREKRIGAMVGTALYHSVDSYRQVLASSGMSQQEIESLARVAKRDFRRIDIHWTILLRTIYARKPYNAETS